LRRTRKVLKSKSIYIFVLLVILSAFFLIAIADFSIEVRESTNKNALIWIRSKDREIENQNIEIKVTVNGVSEWISGNSSATRSSSIEVIDEPWVDTLAILGATGTDEVFEVVQTERPVLVNGRNYNKDNPVSVLIKSVSEGTLMDLTNEYNQTLDSPKSESVVDSYKVYTYQLINEYYVLIDELTPAKGSSILLLTEKITFNHLFQKDMEPHINYLGYKTDTLNDSFFSRSILKSGDTVSIDIEKSPLTNSGLPSIAIIGGLIGAGVLGIGGFLGLRKAGKKVDDVLGSNEHKNLPQSDSPGPTEYSFPDGTKQYTFPDGSVREERVDGSIVGRLADGTTFESNKGVTSIYNNDGSIITSMPDGTYIERVPSSIGSDQIITNYPDGTTTITYDGSSRKITRTPDGKMKVNEPDGSIKTYDKNERIIEAISPEGDRAIRNSSGTFDLEFADGTKGVADVRDNTINAKFESKNGTVEYSYNQNENIKEIHGPDFTYKETPKELSINTPDKSLNFKQHDSGKLEYNYREDSKNLKMEIDNNGNSKLNIKNEDGSQVEVKRSKDGNMQISDSKGSNYTMDNSGNIEGNINSDNGSITFSNNNARIRMNNGAEHQLKRLSNGSFAPIN